MNDFARRSTKYLLKCYMISLILSGGTVDKDFCWGSVSAGRYGGREGEMVDVEKKKLS